jgi:hypothetical protein
MNQLDEEGYILYNDYVTALNKWINYIKPKVIKNYNDLLDKHNKKHYKYEYYAQKYKDNNNIDNNERNDIKKIYNKLSIIFHPDKFAKSNDLFILIKKFYDNNNDIILKNIFDISGEILTSDDESFNNLICNLNNNVCSFEDNATFIINNNEHFLKTTAYTYYMNEYNENDIINSCFTDDELVEEIINSNDKDYKEYYLNKYENDYYIIELYKNKLTNVNNKLREENEKLKNKYESLKNIRNTKS